jgi:chaperonin GroES
MYLQPLADQIVVKINREDKEKEVNGILIPVTTRQEPDQKGVVVEVGSGRLLDNGQRVKSEVAPGDVVLFAKYAGTEIEIDKEKFLIIQERDILGILRK